MKISRWNHINISQPAKLIIINSILIGAIMHQLSVIRISSIIVNKLIICWQCFFGRIIREKGSTGKKRDIIQRPRSLEGLGIRNIGSLNTLLMKKAWRIKHNPQILLSKVYHNSWRPCRPHLLSNRQLPWGRKDILLADKLLNNHCHWKVGDGLSISVTTNWINGGQPIFRDNTPLAELTRLKVAELILPNHQG